MKRKKEKKKDENKLTLRQAVSNFLYAFRLMIKYYPQKFVFTMLFMVPGALVYFFSYTYILRYIVNGLQEGKSAMSLITYVLVMMVVNVVYEGLSAAYEVIISPVVDKKCSSRLNIGIYEKAMEADIANYEDPDSFDLFNRAISNGANAIPNVINATSWFVSNVMRLLLNSWLVLLIDPVLFVFALLPLVFNFLELKTNDIWYKYDVKEKSINRKKDYTRRSFYLNDFAKEMRLTSIHRVMLKRFSDSIREYVALVRDMGLKKSTLVFTLEFGTEVVAIMGAELYALFRTLVSGTMMYGDCLVVLNSIGEISWIIQSFGNLISFLHNIALNVRDYRTFITSEPKVHPNPNGKLPHPGDIELKNVSFRYDGAKEDTLKNVSLHIRQGDKIAVVGHNGAGKTTLVKLLMRLYDPTEGEILYDGVNVKEYRLKDYRSQYGAVFQDYRQLSVSVAENVLGREFREGDEELVTESLKKAGLWEKIEEQERGIHTVMTREFDESGLMLSGGQSQKLALASIYAGNASTVILDEPSSALDPLAEREMYDNMANACRDKTMIFISHRLSSAVDADCIFLMENGTVTESGSHSELMKKNGRYAEMFRMQAQNYTDNVNEGGEENEEE